jgi:hypothetical protein
MSTDITMQELESETAELLPNRETLTVWCNRPSGGSSSYSYTSNHQNAFLSGNNVASGDNVQVNGINLLGSQGGGQSAGATAVGNSFIG